VRTFNRNSSYRVKFKNSLGGFVVNYNGKKIRVSGQLSKNDRIYYWKNKPIGSIAEIRFKEKTSKEKLREPIFIRIRDDKS